MIQVPAQEPEGGTCKLAFVAEAPSDEELDKGQPLVGPSGRVFNAILRSAGIDRREVGITNVFSEKLPDNNVRNWCVPLKDAKAQGLTDLPPIGDNGFLRSEHRHHLDRLAEELKRWQPNVVVPLGGTALWALTGQTGITALRGTPVAASRIVPGVKLLPTFHPAAVMRQWKFFPVAIGDLIKAQRESEYPEVRLASRRLILEPTHDDLAVILPTLLQSSLLSIDIETYGHQITCIGFAPDVGNALTLPFVDARVPSHNYWPTLDGELAAWEFARTVLESNVPKLGQFAGTFDAYVLLRTYGIRLRNYSEDTRLEHHVLYPELPKSLEFMGNSYASQGAWKHWGRRGEKRDE